MTNEETNQPNDNEDRENRASTSRSNEHVDDDLTIFDHLIQSDPALAMALQEQERTTTYMSIFTSPTQVQEGHLHDYDEYNNEYPSQDSSDSSDYEFRPQMDIFQQEETDNDDAEDEPIGLNEVEDLISTGNAINNEQKGLSKSQALKFLSSCTYVCFKNNGIDRCVICQVEYENGELLVALDCDHPYHPDCISKWLQVKRICPMCSCHVSLSKKPKNV